MKPARFVSFSEVAERFRGKRVAIVGSGPSCTQNRLGFVDEHDVVVRVNNYRGGAAQGRRCDVFYSFFGSSIRKSPEELKRDGVQLLMCKVPDAQPIDSPWHRRHGKLNGIDFRYIHRARASWWFGDVWVPPVDRFLRSFHLLRRHVATTGFAAILDVLDCEPAECYLTGFDGFTSGVHNVTEKWRKGDTADPIGHRPELELDWLAIEGQQHPLSFDATLRAIIMDRREVAA